jgi:hypothetical protein
MYGVCDKMLLQCSRAGGPSMHVPAQSCMRDCIAGRIDFDRCEPRNFHNLPESIASCYMSASASRAATRLYAAGEQLLRSSRGATRAKSNDRREHKLPKPGHEAAPVFRKAARSEAKSGCSSTHREKSWRHAKAASGTTKKASVKALVR